ncbi:MAG: hypothetical protein LBQ24_07600 [Candidatus Peribacteria bacterium]|jgi:tetratricopeptide (TPR) repeat protein|nr:hypothetical protein [Candidatus Peribacteria bacterium]
MANEYYIEAENMGIIIEQLLLNRGRYEYRNGNYSEAEEYFMRALEGEVDAFIKAEIYFDLSSIYLGRQEEDFYKQAIEYANL